MKDTYKTTAKQRARLKAKYDAARKERGAEFLAEMARIKREWRAKGSTEWDHYRHRRYKGSFRGRMLIRIRRRARKAGMEATIRTKDIHWPTHCPVLGLELDYDTPRGKREANKPNLPSLDRWDNTIGYIPGNVFVISLRANQLKGNATLEELVAICEYARNKPTVTVSAVSKARAKG